MQNLVTIDYRLGVADRKARLLSRLNPTNATQERQRFLKEYIRGKIYNPHLRYKKPTPSLGQTMQELTSLSVPILQERNEQRFFAKHLEKKRERILEKIQAIQCIRTPAFPSRAKRLFGKPDNAQLREAKNNLRSAAAPSNWQIANSLSAVAAAKIFQRHIDSYAIPWRVKLKSSISSKAGLDSRSKYLLVKTGERFSPQEVQSLCMHEIETHIFRRENGALQQLPHLFAGGFAGPPITEEGLAFFSETQTVRSRGMSQSVPIPADPRRMLIISARTIAAHLAMHKSFFEVFHALVRYGLPYEYAWAVTLRTKRGLSDTSQPGAFPKDHLYLKGYLTIKKYAEEGGDLSRLYIGKLNMGIIRPLDRYNVRTREPKYLPHYLKN